jgi:hypothetical protein
MVWKWKIQGFRNLGLQILVFFFLGASQEALGTCDAKTG